MVPWRCLTLALERLLARRPDGILVNPAEPIVGANAGAFLPERGFVHSSGNVCFATAFQLMRRNSP